MKIDIGQIELIESLLRTIMMHIEDVYGVELMIVDIEPMEIPASSVNLRCPDAEFADVISDYINSVWEYDKMEREIKVATYHDACQHPYIKLQVTNDTRLR